MEEYKNLRGESGVTAYEIGDDFIKVQFHDGAIYLYTYQSAGREAIERMKNLAIAGEGLSSFIGSVVKEGYASKLK